MSASGKLARMVKDTRVIILIIALVLGLFMLHPAPLSDGVVIRSVARNSSAEIAGIGGPLPTAPPTSKERIIQMNSILIKGLEDYYSFLGTLSPNITILIKTTERTYRVELGDLTREEELNETITKTIFVQETVEEEVDGELVNITRNVSQTVEVPKTKKVPITAEEALGLRVDNAPTSNIRLGLDLQGGTRVLLQPEEKMTQDTLATLLDNMKERLNVYGLSDVVVRSASDLSGNRYILVEIAGVNEDEVKNLLAKQGKFEATVGNETVFKGGNDITYVCRTTECAGIDPRRGCGQTSDGGWGCQFYFQITLSPDAAQRQADATRELEVIRDERGEGYLSEDLNLILDDQAVSSLKIAEGLKGSTSTDISIQGSGMGQTRDAAILSALANMKRLQTVLITGSLPVKLTIMKTDTISPALGKVFLKNTMLVAFFAILAVAVIILIRYRRPILVIPILLVNWAEIYLLLAIASLIGWNIDVASIAGIIIMIGTGVNDQIVITDETMRGGGTVERYDWKDRLKKAFFIVFAAYFTTIGSMIPLLFAGAGLLKGFAVTTILGITVGVLITRPAYANIIEIILEE